MNFTTCLRRQRRQRKIKSKIRGTIQRPRLAVFRSNRQMQAQLIDDSTGKILLTMTSLNNKAWQSLPSPKKQKISFALGEEIAQKAQKLNIHSVVFDRRGYKYHGRVKALAEGARKGGLEF